MESTKRILIACNHLNTVGGSELYSFYLIKSLRTLGHQLEYFTFHRGLVSSKIENELHVRYKARNRYDLILASHYTTVDYLYGQGPLVQICHGTIPDLEQPSPLADYHIAVSQEIEAHLKALGFTSTVILNGIDLTVFRPRRTIRKRLKTVLSLCQSEEANTLIKAVCEDQEIGFKSLNKHKNPQFEIADEINAADLVIGIGRSAYDAMACGRPCVLFDRRSYNGSVGDGYMYPWLFERFSTYNCSGRFSKRSFTQKELAKEIANYNPIHGKELRKIAVEKLNLIDVSEALLQKGTEVSGWNHVKHKITVLFSYSNLKKRFDAVKRGVRSKMHLAANEGASIQFIKSNIENERFVLPVRIGLYFFLLKLVLKRILKQKQPSG